MTRIKLLFVFITACVMLTPFSIASAEGQYVRDSHGYLEAEELSHLNSRLASATQVSGVAHYVYISHRSAASEVSEYEVLAAFSLDYGDDAVILAVDCYDDGEYYYELFTYGEGYDLLSDSDCDYILDDDGVYSSIKGGRLLAGTERFANLSAGAIVNSRESAKIMKIAVPIIIGLVSGGIAVLCVVISYRRKLKSPIYPLSKYATLNLLLSSDNYITSTVTRTRIQSSSGGGRSGGGSRGRR